MVVPGRARSLPISIPLHTHTAAHTHTCTVIRTWARAQDIAPQKKKKRNNNNKNKTKNSTQLRVRLFVGKFARTFMAKCVEKLDRIKDTGYQIPDRRSHTFGASLGAEISGKCSQSKKYKAKPPKSMPRNFQEKHFMRFCGKNNHLYVLKV